MKKSILIAALLLFQMVSAQDVTKTLTDFTTVKVFDKIETLLVHSKENKIVIKGSRSQDVEVVNKKGELKVRMKLTKLMAGDDVSVTIYYTGAINSVEASEGAIIASQDNFKATNFELSSKEGSEIKLKIDVQNLTSKANSGGILNITGKAANHDIVITSGGILKGKDLATKQTTIAVNAGGTADVTATDLVDAKTRAGGNIYIHGKPAKVNKKTTAGGNIEVKG